MAAVDMNVVAQRAIDDPEYAWEILEGSEYPEIRDALIQDIRDSDEVSGYLDPQLVRRPLVSHDAWRKQVAPRWSTINFAATHGIVIMRG